MPLEHRTTKTVTKGRPYPLGATPCGDSVNFAVYSRHASEAFVLLFDTPDGEPTDVIRLGNREKFIWHAAVDRVRPGQLYGYKVSGEYRPEHGLRFNDARLLLDPYAKAMTGKFRNDENLLLAYEAQPAGGEFIRDTRDNSTRVPKAIVVDDAAFDWQDDHSPADTLEQLFIYEVHVKGFTAHPSSRVQSPGTYLGFIEKIPHLQRLGINAVELLPVHEFYVDDFQRRVPAYGRTIVSRLQRALRESPCHASSAPTLTRVASRHRHEPARWRRCQRRRLGGSAEPAGSLRRGAAQHRGAGRPVTRAGDQASLALPCGAFVRLTLIEHVSSRYKKGYAWKPMACRRAVRARLTSRVFVACVRAGNPGGNCT
jgi:hypothetical protein